MRKSIKTALLFSTLIIGAVETPNVVNNTSITTPIIAHADSSTTYIQQVKDPVVRNILMQSLNAQGDSYTDPSQITNDELANLNSIAYTGNNEKLSANAFDGINTTILPSITSVQISNVDFSQVPTLQPLTQFNNITTITLNNDNITSDMLSTLGNWSLPTLASIDLSQNKITNLNFLPKIQMPELNTIFITDNQISDFSPVQQVQWPNLNYLNVKNNKISDITPIQNLNWPSLVTLIVDNNNISDINSFGNTDWYNLEKISANNNNISNIDSLAGKTNKFKNLQIFSVDNNHINDISWMNGYTFDTSSSAHAQTINQTVNLVKPSNNSKVNVELSTPINDVTLNNTNGNFVAAQDSNGQNLEADNKYIGSDYAGNYKSGTTFGTPINPSDIDGRDGKSYSSNNNVSNGIKSVNIAYNGQPTSTYSFGFTSNFGIGQPGFFYGAYSLNVNWGENTTQTKPVKVTVNYVDQNGKEISAPQTKTINFVETGFKPDDTKQAPTWNNDWKEVDGNSYSFTSPTVKGYEDPSETQVSGTVNKDSSDVVKTVTYKATPAPSSASSSESQKSSSADSQNQSSASSSTSSEQTRPSSEAQSSSASSEQTNSSSASKGSSNASSEANSSSASSQSSSSASSAQSIPASSQSSASSSSSVSSSVAESSAAPTTTSSSTVVVTKHSNNKGTPKRDHVQPKKTTSVQVATTSSSNHKDAKSLPQTGDKTRQSALISLGAVAIATALSLAAFALSRKKR